MARLQGISGGLSGKTGSFTYRQSGGQTIVSQYQPIVKNPNTAGQQDQRAKFKLMSQLAAVMASGFGTMAITKRPAKGKPSQRNAFVSLNFPLVQVSEDNESVVAKIPMRELKLTSSQRNLGGITALQSEVTVNVQDPAVAAVRFVEVAYINNDVTKPVVVNVVNVPMADMRAQYSAQTVGNFTVLAYGLIPTASASRATLDNLHTPYNEDYFSAVRLDNLVSEGQLAETVTIGVNGVGDGGIS